MEILASFEINYHIAKDGVFDFVLTFLIEIVVLFQAYPINLSALIDYIMLAFS